MNTALRTYAHVGASCANAGDSDQIIAYVMMTKNKPPNVNAFGATHSGHHRSTTYVHHRSRNNFSNVVDGGDVYLYECTCAHVRSEAPMCAEATFGYSVGARGVEGDEQA